MNNKIYIKNMVCPRCIKIVRALFENLEIEISAIQLGEVTTIEKVENNKRPELEKQLFENGFELLKDDKSKILGQIKSLIIEQIHYKKENLKVNFSTFISANLNQEYSSLSKLFSSVEGITIERYIVKQKIEKVKELLFYNQLTLSEIAFQMNYSSTAHLSAQFKKETGMSPTKYKQLKLPNRQAIDSI